MTYSGIKHLHVLTVTVSITLFIVRFFWLCRGSALLKQRWVRIVPHLNDTLLLLTGVTLIFITHKYPFTPRGEMLTEKLFGVIIYILLGHIALGKRERSMQQRWLAFTLALGSLSFVLYLVATKSPLLIGYL